MDPLRELAAFDAVAQFVVPRLAAGALDLSAITRRATELGIERPRVEMNARHARGGLRLTRRTSMALLLIAEWRRVGGQASRRDDRASLREELMRATAAATAGCCVAWNPRRLTTAEAGCLG
jgi:hypothetical protein